LADPFLLAHLVHPLFFDIGGRLAPVSIRDQMVRAHTAVDRGIEEGLIGPGRPLLVIGAGAAGATAAIRSAARGVPTLLIERAPGPFLRQAGCRTRWIDPVQYDWPVDHWQKGLYPPWLPPSMPLPWAADYANHISLAWTLALNRARLRHSRLLVMYRTLLMGRPILLPSRLLQVRLLSSGRALPLFVPVGMVLSCVGAGTERSTHGNYSGFDFWSTDPFQKLASTDRILISGGGDGALQDYLRIVTGLSSAKEIYLRLGIPLSIEQALQSAEDQASRVYIWGRHAHHDHSALSRLHQFHESLATHLLAKFPSLLKTLQTLTAGMPGTVQLMYPCTHFSRCYGLNRFLVLLLATYLQKRGKSTLLSGRSLSDVQGVAHSCSNSPSVCHGSQHDVVTAQHSDCRMSPGAPISLLGTFNVVIVRHGIDSAPPLLAGVHPIAQPRQMLPYHVG
jgi:hypothetical protein